MPIARKAWHIVYLDEYLIGKTEVTVAQFRAFVQAMGYNADERALSSGKDGHPVTYVSCGTRRWPSVVGQGK